MKKQKLQHWILAADLVWASIAMAMAYVLTYGTMLDSTGEKRLFSFRPAIIVFSCSVGRSVLLDEVRWFSAGMALAGHCF